LGEYGTVVEVIASTLRCFR